MPPLFYLWGLIQPRYTGIVVVATNALIRAEEAGSGVTTLTTAGARIDVWSLLRDDGQAANEYNADVLQFYIVLCLAIPLVYPRLQVRRRARVVLATLAAIFLFQTLALLVTVENTYANALVEVAHRNYSPAESRAYKWLYDSFAHMAMELLPAAVLVTLFARYGGIGRGLTLLRGEGSSGAEGAEGAGRPRPITGRRSWRATAVVASLPFLVLAVAGSIGHLGKVRARRAEALCMQGFKSLLSGSPGEAESLFGRSIALRPGFREAWDGQGSAFLASGHSDRALGAYLEALKIDPGYYSSRLGLGKALVMLGRPDEALAEFEWASTLSPDRWEPFYNRGLLLVRKNRVGEAEAAFRKTLELNPSASGARFELSRILIISGRLCEALPQLLTLITQDPASPNARVIRESIEKGKRDCPGS